MLRSLRYGRYLYPPTTLRYPYSTLRALLCPALRCYMRKAITARSPSAIFAGNVS